MRGKTEKKTFLSETAPSYGLIGEYAESSLHRALKLRYTGVQGHTEVRVNGKIVDGITAENVCIEVQTASFGSIRGKIQVLTSSHQVLLVHPIYIEKRILTLEPGGEVASNRKSPKSESLYNMFDELVYTPDFLLNSRLSIELCLVSIREIRIRDGKGGWRMKGVSRQDKELVQILGTRRFQSRKDYLSLVPFKAGHGFTNGDLVNELGITRDLAAKMTNCLKKAGILDCVGKRGRELEYQKGKR